MDMDLDTLIQMMEIMNPNAFGANTADGRRQRIMLTILKLMETKKLMETYGTPQAQGDSMERNLSMLMALRPHMTSERQHITDILIKLFEIRLILNQMEVRADGR